MKALFTSDLHGQIDLYRELLEVADSSSAEVLILGGDLLPSFAPTKRYEDMLPNQKTFADGFLAAFYLIRLRFILRPFDGSGRC
jgi:predicted phosphodiesterase